MNHTLTVDSVILRWGFRQILNGAFISCETGKITGLLGRNGSGKSCLLRIIFGDLQGKEAAIKIDGKYCRSRQRDCRDIRYLPQGTFIPRFFTVHQVFRDFRTDFDDFVHFFPEFAKLRKCRIGKLSEGERRLVEVYTILTAPAKFALLDEPFSQIMPLHIEVLNTLIRRERQHKGILITDHFYRDILDISDALYVLSAGKSVGIRDAEDLKRLGYLQEEHSLHETFGQ